MRVLCKECRDYRPGQGGCGACVRRVGIELGRLEGIVGDAELARLAARSAVHEDGWCQSGVRRGEET